MKSEKQKAIQISIIILITILLAFSCQNVPPQATQPQQTVPQPTSPVSTPSPLFWTGDGGKGKSLGILVPGNQGFSGDLSYVPAMVQGGLVANISKYSAISVLDRLALDKVIAEILDPTYEDSDFKSLKIKTVRRTAAVTKAKSGNTCLHTFAEMYALGFYLWACRRPNMLYGG